MHREEIFAELGKLKNPPKPVEFNKYFNYSKKMENEHGWFWFTDYTGCGRSIMIKKGNFKYCYYTNDLDELYDLKKDPLEINNLVNDREYKDIRRKLRNRLIEWLLEKPMMVN